MFVEIMQINRGSDAAAAASPKGEAGGYQQMQLAALLHSLRPDAPMART